MNEQAPNESHFLLYTNPDGKVNLQVLLFDETVWLTQNAMSKLFSRDKRTISEHISNVFKEGELQEKSVVRKFRTTADDGKKYLTSFYNLDVIISVGYRVKSKEGTQFRIWATQTLKEFIIKGFVLDDERLKQGKQLFGKDYFDDLLERIREIRASERRFYQKITDLYALASDYTRDAPETRKFYASVQNKLHWAITGQTAAEIVYHNSDASKVYMGLKSWKHGPTGKIQKSDVSIAKNYLNEEHIAELNRIVSAYLDLAENNAKRGIVMTMKDWRNFLDNFLKLSSYPILLDNGKVSALEAKLKAEQEFEQYRVIQDQKYLSDFDKSIESLKQIGDKTKDQKQ